ncbi:MAG: type II secretion system protein [Candidatus Competibacterales bacterium]|nr:type II secretion system protein [Candidatus Competibacterales bacterium]
MLSSPGQRGFTLLELLVAFVILSLALGVLLQTFGQGLRNAALTEEYTLATLHAESVLATIGTEQPLTEGESSGEFEDGYEWQISVRRYEDPDAEELLPEVGITPYRVSVRVSWGNAPQRIFELDTLRLAVDTP